MPVLQPAEYDISYFDGELTSLRHNAGYTRYQRWKRVEGVGSRGEYYADLAAKLISTRGLAGKKILELGCAKGFLVEDLRAQGIDAWGLDVSAYAVSQAAPAVIPFLSVADARTALAAFANKSWDAVFSNRFLECIDLADVPALITQMTRIAKAQFHIIDENPNALYYVAQPLAAWLALGWPKFTVLMGNESKAELVK